MNGTTTVLAFIYAINVATDLTHSMPGLSVTILSCSAVEQQIIHNEKKWKHQYEPVFAHPYYSSM